LRRSIKFSLGSLIALGFLACSLAAQKPQKKPRTDPPIKVKVVVVSMFEVGGDVGNIWIGFSRCPPATITCA
jgi:hypothetical protein